MQKKQYQVLIIGAGASGIGAALTLHRAGVPYLVLESRDRIGGRIQQAFINGIEVDLGGCWVHSYNTNNPIRKEIQRMGWKQKAKRNDYAFQIIDEFDGPVSQEIIETAKNHCEKYFTISKQTAQKSKIDLSIEEAGRNYYENIIKKLTKKQKRVVDMLINMTEHYEATSVSPLSAKNYDGKDDHGGDFLPQKSYANLIKTIAKGLNIKLNSKVTDIFYTQNQVRLVCEDRETYYSQKLIASLPLGVLKSKKVKFYPPLPLEYQDRIERLGVGVMNKVVMSFQKPFWKEGVYSIRLASQDRGKYAYTYNFSKDNRYVLACHINTAFARKISQWDDQKIVKDITQTLARAYNNTEIKPKEVVITRWDRDPYCLGSYTSFHVGSSMNDSRELRKAIKNTVWLVGEHCYAEHIGTAHGAFQTGIWAVEEILRILASSINQKPRL